MSLLVAKDSKPLEGGPSFSVGHRLFRAAWNVAWLLLASWTPPPLHRWRVFLLRLFGADVHLTARVYSTAKVWYPPNLEMHAHAVIGPGVDCYCMDRIVIGEKAIISQRAFLCGGTHDITDANFQLQPRPITIGANAWVAAEAFVGPGIRVGERAVIGARGVLVKDAEPDGVYAGNPARRIKNRNMR